MNTPPHTIPLHPNRPVKQQHSFMQEPEERALHRNKYRHGVSKGNYTQYKREQERLKSKEEFNFNSFEKKGIRF